MDTTRVHPPAPDDDTIETHYAGLERLECLVCYDGLVFIGRLELTEEGEEVEVIEPVSCRRCSR